MKTIKILSLIMLISFVTSCEKTLDINSNPNYPASSSMDAALSSGEVFITASVGGDLQLLGSIWSQFYAQHTGSNQYTNIDSYNLTNSASYTRSAWNILYAGALPDLDKVVKEAESEKEWSYWFIGKTLTAFSYHILVDFYGEIPFTDALKGVSVDPKYDQGQVVNAGIVKMLDEALAKADDAITANEVLLDGRKKNDLILNCDIDTWIAFAKTLKLKVLMRDYAANRSLINQIIADGGLLTSDVTFAKFEDKENASNPLYENDRRKLNTPNNLRASSTMVKYLLSNNDPRVGDFFEANSANNYVGLPQGGYTLGSSWTSKTSRAQLTALDPVYLMSAAESNFLQAECLVRDGKYSEAKVKYNNGVTAAFVRYQHDAQPFLISGGAYEFNQTSDSTMLESIWRQNWISCVRTQAWNSFFEINRTGYPVYGTLDSEKAGYVIGQLAPSPNSVLPVNEFPRRLVYPKVSTDFNPNAPVVIPLQTKMWWHKK